MSIVFFILSLLCLLGIIPFFAVFIVQLIRKKKKAVWGFLSLGCLVGVFLFGIIGTAVDPTTRCEHDYQIVEQTEATCTQRGTEKLHCEKCGKTKVEYPAALGHDMAEESRTEPSASQDGEIVLKCTRCGYIETTVLPKLTQDSTAVPKATEEPDASTSAPAQTPTLSLAERLEEYQASCNEIAYTDLARNPEKHNGENFKFRGQVIQVVEPSAGSTVELRVNVTEEKTEYSETGWWDDTIYCTAIVPKGADRILEGDIITFWGQCKGLYSYTSVIGTKVSLPKINIVYFEIE